MRQIQAIFTPRALADNPYQSQLVEHLEKVGVQVELAGYSTFFLGAVLSQWKPDIVHLHWLNPLFLGSNRAKSLLKTSLFLIEIVVLKLLGIKIVWTVHNLKNHENLHLDLDRLCSSTVAKFADVIITHCEAARQEVITMFSIKNKDKVFSIPHGNYLNSYENKIARSEARQVLGVKDSKVVFLFLGLIRPYKGVIDLIDTFKQLPNDEAQLLIVGKVWHDDPEVTELLNQKISEDGRIKLIPGFVPNEKIQLYMNACDVAVFPYRDVLTSGAVLLAMSFGRACVAPCRGCIGEVLDRDGAFLYELDEKEGLLQAMRSAVQDQSNLLNKGGHNRQLAEQYSWERVAEMTLRAYKDSLSK